MRLDTRQAIRDRLLLSLLERERVVESSGEKIGEGRPENR